MAEEAGILNQTTLPAARSVFKAARQAYEAGRSDYLEVLDAERTLVETRRRRVEALAAYHQAVARLEGLLAMPLPKD